MEFTKTGTSMKMLVMAAVGTVLASAAWAADPSGLGLWISAGRNAGCGSCGSPGHTASTGYQYEEPAGSEWTVYAFAD